MKLESKEGLTTNHSGLVVWLIIAGCLGIVLGAGFVLGDSLALYIGSRILSIAILGIYGLFILGRVVWSKLKRQPDEALGRQFMIWLLAFTASYCFAWGCQIKSQSRIAEVKRFVALAVPELHRIKLKSNRYPQRLPSDLAARKPALVNYFAVGNGYVFAYTKPLSINDTYHFDSDLLTWQKWTRD